MTVKEIKKMDTDKLRNTCIKNKWYTAGSNEDYQIMFEMCERDNITNNQLYKIAKNIFEHTNIHVAKQGCSNEYSDTDNILNMMRYINDCTYVFYELK